ncbi:sulfatase-like hydrolase/transferase [Haladaptatus halobius]|uniref:sulfatase-like hydrolase/transferase n=1 Tax=Haladaptatus halobius TaxID=2884875 RepID=UPI001D0A55DD|nr:sulfatase-like hydrolase/transferase [Haladaptatus halobius]
MTNIALIVLDTLRKDAFDAEFDWLPGKRFDNAWSTAKWTIPAHASLFTGKYASEIGIHAKSEGFDCPEPALAECLQQAGYTTRAFSANLMVSPIFGYDRGFDTFEGTWRINVNSKSLKGWKEILEINQDSTGLQRYTDVLRRAFAGQYRMRDSIKRGMRKRSHNLVDKRTDDGAAKFLEKTQKTAFGDDEFLFANLMEAHAPYTPPNGTIEDSSYDEVAATLTDDEPDQEHIRKAYDEAVHYLTDQYQQIFAELKQDFDYVITIGDHGELFGEHGSWRHLHGVYPELAHIPVVISGSDCKGVCTKTTSILDVHRTILELTDVDAPSRGQNLLGEITDRPRLVEYEGLRSARIRMMQKAGYPTSLIETFDKPLTGIALSRSYYGYETRDGWEEVGSPAVSDPQKSLGECRQTLDVRETTNDTIEIADAVKQQLRDLGYA